MQTWFCINYRTCQEGHQYSFSEPYMKHCDQKAHENISVIFTILMENACVVLTCPSHGRSSVLKQLITSILPEFKYNCQNGSQSQVKNVYLHGCLCPANTRDGHEDIIITSGKKRAGVLNH